jgi:glycine/D-amino acid oxidase-like deaminating enzyme
MCGFENCLEELRDFDCDLELSGCLELAHSHEAASAPLDWRDGAASLRTTGRVPGGTVHPGRLLASLVRAACAAGASLHQNVAVSGLEFSDPPRVLAAGRALTADRVVLATNGYSLGMSALEGQAICMLAVAVASAPLASEQVAALGLTGPRAFYTEDLPYLWGRLTPDNRLVIGSGLVDPVESKNVAADAQPKYRALERRIRGLHPVLRECRFTHHWLGPVCIAGDYRPVLRQHPRSAKIWFGGAYSGHGVAQSLRMGRLLAERISFSFQQSLAAR